MKVYLNSNIARLFLTCLGPKKTALQAMLANLGTDDEPAQQGQGPRSDGDIDMPEVGGKDKIKLVPHIAYWVVLILLLQVLLGHTHSINM